MTPRKSGIRFNGHDISLIRSLWWNDEEQRNFNTEIAPYFRSLWPSTEPPMIVDAGEAYGIF